MIKQKDHFGARLLSVALLCAAEPFVTEKFCDGFRIAWENEDGESSAKVQLSEERLYPETYRELARWSFASVTNLKGNVQTIDDDSFAAEWPGIVGELIKIPANTTGLIQLGTTSNRGYVTINEPPDGVEAILLCAKIKNGNDGPKRLNFGYIRENRTTNLFLQTYLTDELQRYFVQATNGAPIVLWANAKAYPPQIADIKLIADYSTPYTVTNTIQRADAGRRERWTFRNLSPGEYLWRVERHIDDDPQAAPPEFSRITLSPDDKPMPVGFTVRVR